MHQPVIETTFADYRSTLGKIKSAIYMLTHNPSGKRYVGQSKEVKKRWTTYYRRHKSLASQPKLFNLLSATDLTEWTLTILEEVNDPADLLDVEDKWIEKLGTEKELNCSKGQREFHSEKLPISSMSQYLKQFFFVPIGNYYIIGAERNYKIQVSPSVNCNIMKNEKISRAELKKICENHFLHWRKELMLEKLISRMGWRQTHKTVESTNFFVDVPLVDSNNINFVGKIKYANEYFEMEYSLVKEIVTFSNLIIAEKI